MKIINVTGCRVPRQYTAGWLNVKEMWINWHRNLGITIAIHRTPSAKGSETRKKEEFKIFHKQEIFSSSFEKSILLPEDVNDDEIRASFRDGLLTIELPKGEHPCKPPWKFLFID